MFDIGTYDPISPQVTAKEIGRYSQELRRQTEGAGSRVGNRAEFTLVAPVIQPDGPAVFRDRAKKAQIEAPYWEGRLGTVHDLRVCLNNNDQQLLLAATYSDEFMPYVRDVIRFAGPWIDYIFTGVAEGYPGMKSTDEALQYITKYQVEAGIWYGGPDPEATPRDITKSLRVSNAFNQLLDTVQE
ncbi:hypothetical protein ACFWIO_05220 [Streptomyces diastatochromogenes]|uniref:hypothetical protein n=1 Tax=Streptomyces diastatochromogenes TaxID=42236 RepID=UPI003654325A